MLWQYGTGTGLQLNANEMVNQLLFEVSNKGKVWIKTWIREKLIHSFHRLSPQSSPNKEGGSPKFASCLWADMRFYLGPSLTLRLSKITLLLMSTLNSCSSVMCIYTKETPMCIILPVKFCVLYNDSDFTDLLQNLVCCSSAPMSLVMLSIIW